jgi:hypothetical protein
MGLYTNRLQAPVKTLSADWIPTDGEIFQDSSDNIYMGDGVTASNALTPIGGAGGGTQPGMSYTWDTSATDATGIANGQIRRNNATMGSVTTLYIAQNDADVNDKGTVLATLSAGGLLYITNVAGDARSEWKVTAAVDSGTYYTLTASYLSGVEPADDQAVFVVVAPVEVTGVREYYAVLTFDGTANPPSVSVIKNSFGGTIAWSYWSIGNYAGTLTGAFVGTTYVSGPSLIPALGGDEGGLTYKVSCFKGNENAITVQIGTSSGAEDYIAVIPIHVMTLPA